MRQNVISLLLLIPFFSVMATAQEDSCYFPTGMCWREVLTDAENPIDTTFATSYEIGGDTLVCGVNYKKVYIDGRVSSIWIRENNDCVWLRSAEYAEEILLYNFNLNSEDPIQMEYLCETDDGFEKKTTTIEQHELQTTVYQEHTYQYYHDFSSTYLFGLGCVATLRRNSALLGYKELEAILPGLIYVKVLWIWKHGEYVFRSTNAEEWTVSMPTSVCSITKPTASHLLYDLQGRRLIREPEKGMYIKDGRKYIRK